MLVALREGITSLKVPLFIPAPPMLYNLSSATFPAITCVYLASKDNSAFADSSVLPCCQHIQERLRGSMLKSIE